MFKKSFYLAAVFSAAILFASCQHDPTILNSTSHKPGDSKPLSRENSAGKENTESNSMKEEVANQNTANRSETNRSG